MQLLEDTRCMVTFTNKSYVWDGGFSGPFFLASSARILRSVGLNSNVCVRTPAPLLMFAGIKAGPVR